MYDTRDVPEFKKDGWQWQKRKDQSGRVRLTDHAVDCCILWCHCEFNVVLYWCVCTCCRFAKTAPSW